MTLPAPSQLPSFIAAPFVVRPGEPPAHLWLRPRLDGDGGVRQLAAVGFPLVLSSLCSVINLFFDRLFLARFDSDPTLPHMNASLTASLTWWWLLQLSMGIVIYAATFVSQYVGAGRPKSVGAVVWQAIYLSLAFGFIMLGMGWLWEPFFAWLHATNPQLATFASASCHAIRSCGTPARPAQISA